MTHARHAKPATRTHRILTGAGETLAVLAVLAGAAFGIGTVADAATVHHPSALHRLERAIVDHETFSVDGRTYLAHQVKPWRRNAADARLCASVRAWDAAGLPGTRLLRDIARDGLSATQPYRNAAGQLVMAVEAGGSFYVQDNQLQEYCNPGYAS